MTSLADKIRKQLKAGKRPKEIAAMFGTSEPYVRAVRQRTTVEGFPRLMPAGPPEVGSVPGDEIATAITRCAGSVADSVATAESIDSCEGRTIRYADSIFIDRRASVTMVRPV